MLEKKKKGKRNAPQPRPHRERRERARDAVVRAVVFKVHFDRRRRARLRVDCQSVGRELGERGDERGHSALSEQQISALVDRSPFDYLGGNLNPGLMGALYDAMGKAIEEPAYKLFGQKVRDRVPVAAWTRPAAPAYCRASSLWACTSVSGMNCPPNSPK